MNSRVQLCMHVSIQAFVHACMPVCRYVCMHVFPHVGLCMYVGLCMHLCLHVGLRTYARNVYACIHVGLCIYNSCTAAHACIYTRVYIIGAEEEKKKILRQS